MSRHSTEHQHLKSFHAISDSIHAYLDVHSRTGKAGSQAEEDAVLAELLPPREAGGIYVDIGANHPWECSNTWQFYRRGWRGILVEPVPMFLPRLTRYRPGDAVFPVAASNKAGYAILRFCGSVSSMREDWPIAVQHHLAVETMTLTNIVRQFPGFMRAAIQRGGWDLCSIDVEGHEREVIEGIEFDIFKPKVMCVEYISYTDDNTGIDLSGDWEPLLLTQGYVKVAQTPFNKIYQLAENASS